MSDNRITDPDPMHFATEYEDGTNWPDLAKTVVEDWYIMYNADENPTGEFYVVWFCFILGNAKALVSSTMPNGKYYEVTFNREKREVYIDTYVKTQNIKGELVKA